jgi:uncharacterized protein
MEPGTPLKGVVRNIAPFGAFVDVGAKCDGLVHVTQMSEHFVRQPHEFMSLGEVVSVWVTAVELEKGRLSLSLLRPGQKESARQRQEQHKEVLRRQKEYRTRMAEGGPATQEGQTDQSHPHPVEGAAHPAERSPRLMERRPVPPRREGPGPTGPRPPRPTPGGEAPGRFPRRETSERPRPRPAQPPRPSRPPADQPPREKPDGNLKKLLEKAGLLPEKFEKKDKT